MRVEEPRAVTNSFGASWSSPLGKWSELHDSLPSIELIDFGLNTRPCSLT